MFGFDIPANILERPYYINRVMPFVRQNLIKVFTGQRRVGKSYLLFQIMQIVFKIPDAIVLYINKEDLAFSDIQTAKDLHDYVLQHKTSTGKTYVFIDEIQDIAQFEGALYCLLLHSDIDLYCTGSNANMLSGDIQVLSLEEFLMS